MKFRGDDMSWIELERKLLTYEAKGIEVPKLGSVILNDSPKKNFAGTSRINESIKIAISRLKNPAYSVIPVVYSSSNDMLLTFYQSYQFLSLFRRF